jgi:hypothetical protein
MGAFSQRTAWPPRSAAQRDVGPHPLDALEAADVSREPLALHLDSAPRLRRQRGARPQS